MNNILTYRAWRPWADVTIFSRRFATICVQHLQEWSFRHFSGRRKGVGLQHRLLSSTSSPLGYCCWGSLLSPTPFLLPLKSAGRTTPEDGVETSGKHQPTVFKPGKPKYYSYYLTFYLLLHKKMAYRCTCVRIPNYWSSYFFLRK